MICEFNYIVSLSCAKRDMCTRKHLFICFLSTSFNLRLCLCNFLSWLKVVYFSFEFTRYKHTKIRIYFLYIFSIYNNIISLSYPIHTINSHTYCKCNCLYILILFTQSSKCGCTDLDKIWLTG